VVAVADAVAGAYLSVVRLAELSSGVPRGPLPVWLRSTRALERFRNEVALAQVRSPPLSYSSVGLDSHSCVGWIRIS
jgi:hypothetical protein